MARVLVPLAKGCEEIEAVTIIDVLRRGGIDVVSASLEAGNILASRGVTLVADTQLEYVLNEAFDMVVLPGGGPGSDRLQSDERILTLLRKTAERGAYTAAICAAPKVLASAGLLEGRKAVGYPGVLDAMDLSDVELVREKVVQDGRVITSEGPGTAMDFALELVEILSSRENRESVEAGLRPV